MSARDRETIEALARVAAALDGAVLGLGTAALAAASLAKYLAASGALRLIAEAPALAIPDLRYSLLAGLGDGESRLAVVRGLVRSPPGGTFLIPPGSREHCVVTRHTQTCLFGEWRGIFGWTFDLHALFFKSLKEQIITSSRWVSFGLVDPASEKSGEMVHVKFDGAVHQSLPLTTVYHKLIPVEQNSYTLFQTIVGNGYPIALLDEEKILPIGKEITAIGLCRLKNRSVEISSCPELPYFLSDLTKGEMEAEMSSRARFFFWVTVALGTVSVGLLGHAIYRLWERVKRHREAREAQERFHEADNEDDAGENGSDDEPGEMGDGQLCVICLRKRRRAAFVPCGHLVCCCNCAKRVELMDEPLCPVCRQDIQYMLRVYDS
ncbi:hypothetical protein CFC21_050893 [Triticum aestivum]|uniref:RING-type E3 ubiquitin transferase n=4 Tax=Triticum TaxID=4564 RepID=A0A9R0S5T4_TRITD|nr:E3 ubiquitin-protein ligase SPL2-like [Triticum dicoccoides]XP_044362157.1 E3 ubiquitin-protein ligase SPL2-like [Triticum aestivum]XP_044362158.1 E3 ubiquitin-protein ligase SPL2-like [Triticum aestivum]XP_048572462.1 E3 ubiquitin-protein ligase SPL2 [Triticum urartu]XP_048572463.1 E3 ubiquitin-protein ligase SPL2 [Triticum urartu]VAH87076.1 unnamed protein product [Triticum turgidum subsp. durum]KAF7041057.1 hypothetical protein CFC21_050893 [Triticum aestivum]